MRNEVKPAETVSLTIEVPKHSWETLVEYSRECRHDTPARTVLLLLYPALEVFLRGKSLGVQVGSNAATAALSLALDKVLPETKKA